MVPTPVPAGTPVRCWSRQSMRPCVGSGPPPSTSVVPWTHWPETSEEGREPRAVCLPDSSHLFPPRPSSAPSPEGRPGLLLVSDGPWGSWGS